MPIASAAALGVALLLFSLGLSPDAQSVDVLKSTGALPAHIAGRFEELAACQRTVDGDYFVFDRRSHTVFRVASSFKEAPREVVGVGVEPGRILHASTFDSAPDRTFVIADAPYGTPRVQIFHETGSRLGGFALARLPGPIVTMHEIVVNGVGSIEYTGQSIFVNQPESGALITEYSLDGAHTRAFGILRRTGHEEDRDVHLALNTGRIVADPTGGFYFVFLAGVPVFRKYDPTGKLLFERHIEGPELDEYVRTMPTTWARRGRRGEIPLVKAAVRNAAADSSGNLWISLAVPFTYVYDSTGQKRRIVQFRGAGLLLPTSLFFGREGRLLVTPGCYAFDTKGASPARNLAARDRTPY
jgi:hypothetical protein